MTAISHEDVVRVAKEVFHGLTDEQITVRGIGETSPFLHWSVAVRFGDSPDVGFEVISAKLKDEPHPEGGGGKLCRVGIHRFPDEATLRRFLEDCRDMLAKNLEAALAAIHGGPVRVLPRDDELDRERLFPGREEPQNGVAGWLGGNRDARIEDYFENYRLTVLHRRRYRAQAAARKSAGH